ncbi:MAG: DUF1761 domain-containing protein [Gemmatimonadales bacterium]
MPEVNYLAVLIAAVAAFVLGWIWYSPALFYKPWTIKASLNLGTAENRSKPMAGLLGLAFLCALIAAYAMAVFLVTPQHHSLLIGLKRGFAAGVCWIATAFGSNYAFENRSLKHWTINAGYYVAQFTVMGAVLGLMNN